MQTPGFRFQTIGIEGVFVCSAMKQLPNILTGCRILFSVALIFVPLFGLWFFVLYIAAGLTDIADGIAARHLDAESRFGALFDSFADVFFLIICTIRILPVLSIDTWLWIWMLIIVLIKIVSMISALVYKHNDNPKPTRPNIHGALLFVFICFAFPFTFDDKPHTF